MVRTRYSERFERHVIDLWHFLKKVMPDDHNALNKVYGKFRRMDREQYLQYILNNLQPGIDFIARNDEFVFMPECSAYNKNKPLNFLIGYDFRRVWRNNPTTEQKKIIFRYLQLIYIQASLALNQNQEKVKEIADSIKTHDEIAKEAEENPNAFGDGESGEGEGMDFQKLFSNDNLLTELAKDISEEVNLQETLKELVQSGNIQPGANPMETVAQLANNPQIKDMIVNLQNKVGKKLQDRNVSKEELQQSAETLKENLIDGIGANMPGGSQLKRMLRNMDWQNMAPPGRPGPGRGGANMQNSFNDFQNLMQQYQQNMQQAQAQAASSGTAPPQPPDMQQMMSHLQEQWKNDPNFQQMMQGMRQAQAPAQPQAVKAEAPAVKEAPAPAQTEKKEES